MPRIRTVKPEFFGSPDTAKASFKARLLYIAMWCWADDYGVGLTNLQSLAGFAFEHDDTSASEVQSLLSEIQGSFGVVFYTVGGRNYYAIPSWDDHQKTQRKASRRNPGPDHPDSVPDQRFNEEHGTSAYAQGSSVSTQGDSPLGKGKGTGEREQGNSLAQTSGSSASEFEAFWSVYPRKVGKKTAKTKYAAAVKRAGDEQTVIDGARRLAADPNLPEQRYIPHPTTWLERDGWDDEPLPSPVRPAARGNTLDAWGTPAGQTPQMDFIDGEVVEFRRALP